MRRRSGAVHCQTYQDLINILDQKTPQILHYPDIQSLLLQQQLASPNNLTSQNYFFSDREQLHAQEQSALAETPEFTTKKLFITTQIVFICQELTQIHQQLLSLKYVQDTYSSIYKDIALEEDPTTVEVNNHIVRVDRRSKNVSSDSGGDFQGHEVSNHCDNVTHSNAKLESLSLPITEMNHFNLQLVIYYNKLLKTKKIELTINQENQGPLYQHKIWLISIQSQQYCPILQAYLQKAQFVFRASLDDQQIQLSLLKQGKNKKFETSSIQQQIHPQRFQTVLALLEKKERSSGNI